MPDNAELLAFSQARASAIPAVRSKSLEGIIWIALRGKKPATRQRARDWLMRHEGIAIEVSEATRAPGVSA